MWACHLCRPSTTSSAGTFHDHYMTAHHAADLDVRRALTAARPRGFVDRAGVTASGRGAFTAERERMRADRAT